MQFTCESCERTIEHDPDGTNNAVPKGWCSREICGTKLFLCSHCGNLANLVGGPSPQLKAAALRKRQIDLPMNALSSTQEEGK